MDLVLLAINHFQTPTLRKLICQLLLKSHFATLLSTSLESLCFQKPVQLATSCCAILWPTSLINLWISLCSSQPSSINGCAALSSLVGRSIVPLWIHFFSLLTFFSVACSLFLQLFPPRHSPSTRVDDVNLVTPVNPVTPITPFIPSPPSPHHHPLHHPSWRWWPTSRRGRTEVDWVSKTVPVFCCCFFTSKCPLYCSFLWLLFLDSIPLNLSWAPYWSLDWRYKWNSSAAFSNLMQFSHPFTFWRAGCRIFIAFPIEIKGDENGANDKYLSGTNFHCKKCEEALIAIW